MYVTKKGFNRIKKTAIPNIQLEESKSGEDKISSPVVIAAPVTTVSNVMQLEESKEGESKISSPVMIAAPFTTVSNVMQLEESKEGDHKIASFTKKIESPSCTSLSESILDTPRKASLRKNLRFCKRTLLEKKQKS